MVGDPESLGFLQFRIRGENDPTRWLVRILASVTAVSTKT